MMLNNVKTLKGYTLNSRDGDIGKVKEFYFDDQQASWLPLESSASPATEGGQQP